MNNYNQSIATTTDYDALGVVIGYSVKETTYNYFDLVILFLIPLTFIFLYKLFTKKR